MRGLSGGASLRAEAMGDAPRLVWLRADLIKVPDIRLRSVFSGDELVLATDSIVRMMPMQEME